ncbi:MAG: hypothetical protein ABH816_02600 [Candidatus Levyibacteriota bacterium]
MKIQDVMFFVIFAVLLWRRDPKLAVLAGLVCLVVSIPLFNLWVFFTAERLTWYAGAFFFLSIIFYLINSKKEK